MFPTLLALSIVIPIVLIAIMLRRVVPTNEVHIVQSSKGTTSYGKDQKGESGRLNGNAYYEWPSWVPVIGITKVNLPTSVFRIVLEDYEAYDKGRLPFAVDVVAFFRVADSNTAAQRVSSFPELEEQLSSIVKGAIRTVLAGYDIEEIMQNRSTFGEAFTKEVNEQLANWGVTTVKTMELMDLRDGENGHAIKSIMEKKKSHIDMESRSEVAKNNKIAVTAEIEAKREMDLRAQEAQQIVGLRTAETKKEVDVANEKAAQFIKEQQRVTKEKEMEVVKVQAVKSAEINKEAAIVKAEQHRQEVEIAAAATLEQQKKDAEGIEAQGRAKGEAEKALQLAPVAAQLELARGIAENKGYQEYLVSVRRIESDQVIGVEQAKALDKANIKIIANTGSAPEGISSVGQLFSSKGGQQIGAALEGLMNTPAGRELMRKVGIDTEHSDTAKVVQ